MGIAMKTKLKVKYFDGTNYTDMSQELAGFKRDTVDITLATGQYIYVGFKKQINALYFHANVFNESLSDLTGEYYNGAWTEFDLDDCTDGFNRDGFIHWDRVSDGESVAVDDCEMCWWRFSVNIDTTMMTIQALNILFSDDDDLCTQSPALIDPCFYSAGAASHILYHVSARDKIISELRRLGYITNSGNSIDEWDILDIEEFKLASTYYAISQIYFNLSDSPEDQYWTKYQEYMARYNEAFSLSRVSIDLDGDGNADASTEVGPIRTKRWIR